MANTFTYQDQNYHTGDIVKLHMSVSEGDKTRTQIFEGIIIKINGEGNSKSIVVRKIGANSIGVERIVPLGTPNLTKIEVKSYGKVRRAKLYYLRDRIGRQATKVRTQETPRTAKGKANSEKAKPQTKGAKGRAKSKKASSK